MQKNLRGYVNMLASPIVGVYVNIDRPNGMIK